MTAETTQEGEMTGVTEAAVDAAHAAATEFARRWGDPVPPRGMIRRMLGASARWWSTQEREIDHLRTVIREVDAHLDSRTAAEYREQPLASHWSRITKVCSEAGEVMDALSKATGENPRKGVCGTWEDVTPELGDVLCAAAFAIQHVTKNEAATFAVIMAAFEKAHARVAAVEAAL